MYSSPSFFTQTPAEHVAEVYAEFVATYPSLTTLDEASPEELSTMIEPLRFQHMRAKALTEIAATHDAPPANHEELFALPRVGSYVADGTLYFGVGERRPIVDRKGIQVYNRVFSDA